MTTTPPEPFSPDLVLGATGVLADLNRDGVLTSADLHVAATIARLAGEQDEAVELALALTVRGVRLGSSCTDLDRARGELPDGYDDLLPSTEDWWSRILASALVDASRPALVVERPLLSLPRFHRLETSLSRRLAGRCLLPPPVVDDDQLSADLARLFPQESFDEQRQAAEVSARSRTSVLTGGPGTGKTTTIARLLVALRAQHSASHDNAASSRPLTVGLAAPTGKAAARMRQALSDAATAEVFTDAERSWLQTLDAVTLHRLLGPRPDHRTAFRHHAEQRLPYDVVIVDETSMVSLLMTERLIQAVPDSCRLVLVGDAEQLASVEAGAVLRDVIDGLEAAGQDCVTRLRRGFRFSGVIGDLAEAVVNGDGERAIELLTGGDPAVRFAAPEELDDVVAAQPQAQAVAVAAAAAAGDAPSALSELGRHRLLCAHRDGPLGVATWNERIEQRVRAFSDPARPWFVGRPVLVTRNDPGLGVNNGDAGVTWESAGRLVVSLDSGRQVASARLSSAQSAYASTVHRSQGSEFDAVTLLMPEPDSPIATRELLYTAITRARSELTVVGTPEAVLAAVERRTTRASGVADRLRQALGAGTG